MSRVLEAQIEGRKFLVNPKRFKTGREGWYEQIKMEIDGKVYRGSIMLYGEKP